MNRKLAGSLAGAAILGGILGVLVKLGNPGNMGICGACFLRDIAGGLGLHSATPLQYLRPEVFGVLLGALAAALVFREWKAVGGAAPVAKFMLGAWIALGALVFLGCPMRAMLRLGGGDANALVGIGGLIAGIGAGVFLLKQGYTLGRARPQPGIGSWILPLAAVGLIAALVIAPAPIRFSQTGPGSLHAPWFWSLALGAVAGFLFQRLRFCSIAAWRDSLFFRDPHMLILAVVMVGVLAGVNLYNNTFHWGFADQPVAHTNHLWNFLGMVLTGLACQLAGGCPVRHLVLAGEGSQDSGMVILGMLTGGALAHNMSWASGPTGVAGYGPVVVVVGLAACIVIGFRARPLAEAG